MVRHLSARDIDWTLLVIALLICAVGVLQIYSVTRGSDSHSAWWKQILYVLGGLVLMWLVLPSDYHAMLHHGPLMYMVSVGALLGTYVVGEAAFGSTRWIPLGFGLHLQVSEFVKLVIILLVARYLTDLRTDELEFREMLKLAGQEPIPAPLGLKQPDIGTALAYFGILPVGVFLAGLHWKYVLVIVAGGALVNWERGRGG